MINGANLNPADSTIAGCCATTFPEVMRCAKPLILDYEERENPFEHYGTAFLTRFGSRYFCITAQHCLGKPHPTPLDSCPPPELLFITLEHEPTKPLPMKSAYLMKGDLLESDSSEDWDFSDLGLYEVEANLQRGDFLDMDYFALHPPELCPQAVLSLRGYPCEFNHEDNDARIIHSVPFELDGEYDRPAEQRHCSVIRFGQLENINDFHGLSGSPIFEREFPESSGVCRFAGMLIKGNAKSGIGWFIHSSVVVEALRRCSAETTL